MIILPSIASADLLHIAREIDRLGDWPYLHFDIEDGNFTPNITFGQKMLAKVGAYIAPRRMDVHMMATDPLALLPFIRDAGAMSVSAHLEALRFPLRFLNTARDMGMRAGLALNVGTPLSAVEPFLEAMDFLLVMTAEPDARGEALQPHALQKALTAAGTLPVDVIADGALNEEAVHALDAAGAYGCVLGRLVFRSDTPCEAIRRLTGN